MTSSMIRKTLPLLLMLMLGYMTVPGAPADVIAQWDCKGISVDQSGPSTATVGGMLAYEIRVRNEGNCSLTDAEVVDFIPRMSVFHDATPAPTSFPSFPHSPHDGMHPVPKIQWSKVSLDPGSEVTFKILARVRSPEDRVLLNTVCFENSRTGRLCSQLETTVSR